MLVASRRTAGSPRAGPGPLQPLWRCTEEAPACESLSSERAAVPRLVSECSGHWGGGHTGCHSLWGPRAKAGTLLWVLETARGEVWAWKGWTRESWGGAQDTQDKIKTRGHREAAGHGPSLPRGEDRGLILGAAPGPQGLVLHPADNPTLASSCTSHLPTQILADNGTWRAQGARSPLPALSTEPSTLARHALYRSGQSRQDCSEGGMARGGNPSRR